MLGRSIIGNNTTMNTKLSTISKALLSSSLASTALLASAVFAQTTLPSSDSKTIEKITVLGSKIETNIDDLPSSVSVLDQAYIKASGAVFVTDLLKSFAGMNISRSGPNGTLTEVRFRGSETNHILVLVNGVEVNDISQGRIADLAHIQASDVERIELLRGPQSALWGASAVSAVINIITKGQNNSKGLQVDASGEIATQNTQRIGLNVSSNSNDAKLAINLSHYQTDGFNISREGNGLDNSEDDGYKNTQLSANYQRILNNEHTLTFNTRLAQYESDFDATDFVNTGLSTDADNVSEGTQVSAKAMWAFLPKRAASLSSNLSHKASLQYSQQDTENFSGEFMTGSSKGEKIRINWISTLRFEQDHFVNLGLDYIDETVELPVSGADILESDNATFALTSDGRYFFNESFNATASIRYDNSDEFDSAVSYRAGLNYDITSQLRAFASLGKAVSNPTFTERFSFFPAFFIGNPDLEPESAVNQELGLVYSTAQNTVSLSYFNTDLENEINSFVFVPELGLSTAQNSELKSKREGVEVSASGSYEKLNWQAHYTYLDAKDAFSKELRRANHTGSATLRYRFDADNALFVQADYTGSQLDIFFPPFPQSSQIINIGAYWLVNANYTYSFDENLDVSLRVSNLLDEEYENIIGFVGQGRQVSLNLNYRLF